MQFFPDHPRYGKNFLKLEIDPPGRIYRRVRGKYVKTLTARTVPLAETGMKKHPGIVSTDDGTV